MFLLFSTSCFRLFSNGGCLEFDIVLFSHKGLCDEFIFINCLYVKEIENLPLHLEIIVFLQSLTFCILLCHIQGQC